MKAVIAVLLVAVAMAHAGLIASPYAAIPAISTVQTAPIAYAAPLAYAAPAAVAAPAVAYAAGPVVSPVAGATYVSQTRGAVHVAPLPGHAIGSIQTNVAPAPGTL